MGLVTTDFLIVGGGVCGLTMALELRERFADASITVLEKESHCGAHASGRNSGVLHAGFYYTADSLKARFTVEGNRAMRAYCQRRGLPVYESGKLVVAQTEAEIPVLQTLFERGAVNGVELERLTLEEARRIEPRVLSSGDCLYSPNTASVDPRTVMRALAEDCVAAGIQIRTRTPVRRVRPEGSANRVQTPDGEYSAGYLINAAGLYADRIARPYGFDEGVTIMPFKGLYLEVEEAEPVRTQIYPVPNIRNPFLGVHYTVAVDGKVTLGPTAIPALWREHYTGLSNFSLREMLSIVGRQMGLALRNDFGFRTLARDELPKYLRSTMVHLARQLAVASPLRASRWGPPGIRAQLIDTRRRELVMDFLHRGDERSFHVLNAVSPAFTCSFPFSRYLVDEIEGLLHPEKRHAQAPPDRARA